MNNRELFDKLVEEGAEVEPYEAPIMETEDYMVESNDENVVIEALLAGTLALVLWSIDVYIKNNAAFVLGYSPALLYGLGLQLTLTITQHLLLTNLHRHLKPTKKWLFIAFAIPCFVTDISINFVSTYPSTEPVTTVQMVVENGLDGLVRVLVALFISAFFAILPDILGDMCITSLKKVWGW